MREFYVVFLCVLIAVGSPALAQDKPVSAASPLGMTSTSNEPLEVSADGSLEWHQDQRVYLAKGNAKAKRGNVTVEADLLTAHEREKDKTASQKKDDKKNEAFSGDVDVLTAEGNVRITDPKQQIFGDKAIYDLDKKIARITGGNLKYVTSRDVITAKDALEYHENEQVALARGKAQAVHQDRRIEADIMKAHFTQSASGQMEMSTMTAEGNVSVVTKNDVTRGDKAVYDIKRNVAVMQGNVRISRADTQLSGDRAEVDFTKGESRLINQGSGRVRAVLTPKSMDSGAKSAQKSAPVTTKSGAKK